MIKFIGDDGKIGRRLGLGGPDQRGTPVSSGPARPVTEYQISDRLSRLMTFSEAGSFKTH